MENPPVLANFPTKNSIFSSGISQAVYFPNPSQRKWSWEPLLEVEQVARFSELTPSREEATPSKVQKNTENESET